MNWPEQVSAQPCRGAYDRGPWNDPDPSNAGAHAVYPYPVQPASRCATRMAPFGAYPLEHMLYSARLIGHPPASSPGALYLMQHHLADPRQQWPAHPQMWPPGTGPQQPLQSWRGRVCGDWLPTAYGTYPHMPAGMLQPYHAQPWRQPHPPPGDPPTPPQQDHASRGFQGGQAGSASRHQNGFVEFSAESSSNSSSSSRHRPNPHLSQLRASAPSFPAPLSAAASTDPSPSPAAHSPMVSEAPHPHHHNLNAALANGPVVRAAQLRALKKKPKMQKALGEVPADAAAAAQSTAASATASHSSLGRQAACRNSSPATSGDTTHAAGDHGHDAVLEGHDNDAGSQSSEAADLAEAVSHLLLPLQKEQCSIKDPDLEPNVAIIGWDCLSDCPEWQDGYAGHRHILL